MIKICLNCKREYETKKKTQKFCCRHCIFTVKKFPRKCSNCDNIRYYTKKEIEKWDKGKFCSKQCVNEHRKNNNKIIIKCKGCQKPFKILKTQKGKRQYCSRLCVYNSSLLKGTKDVILNCIVCNNTFIMKQGEINRNKKRYKNGASFCSYSCRTSYQRTKQAQNSKRTNIEVIMDNALKYIDISFDEQKRFGKYVVDFFIPNQKIIIECDGDYWHSLPNVIKSDKKKNEYLKSKGYKVLRFTETEINTNIDQCVLTILKEISVI